MSLGRPDPGVKKTGDTMTGALVVPDGTAAAPGLRVASEASGIYRCGPAAIGLAAAGVMVAQADANTFTVSNYLYLSGELAWSAARARLYALSGTQLRLADAAMAVGIVLDISTDGVLALRDKTNAVALGQLREMLLANTRLDLSVGTKQALYTGPAGATFIITDVILENPSAPLTVGTAVALGRNAGATDWRAATVISGALSSGSKGYRFANVTGGFELGAPGDVFGLIATTPEAAPLTVGVQVFGYTV